MRINAIAELRQPIVDDYERRGLAVRHLGEAAGMVVSFPAYRRLTIRTLYGSAFWQNNGQVTAFRPNGKEISLEPIAADFHRLWVGTYGWGSVVAWDPNLEPDIIPPEEAH